MNGSHKYSQKGTTGLPQQTFAARGHERWQRDDKGNFLRSKRNVWVVATKPFKGSHFATFPPKLIEPCILAGCPEGGVVLDPFFGAGTTALVANNQGKKCIGIEINPEYCEIAKQRLQKSTA
jgi:DNA modification methylase